MLEHVGTVIRLEGCAHTCSHADTYKRANARLHLHECCTESIWLLCVFMCVCARVFARPRSPTLQSLGKAGKTLDVEQWCFPICHAPQHHHPTKPLCTCMCMLAE